MWETCSSNLSKWIEIKVQFRVQEQHNTQTHYVPHAMLGSIIPPSNSSDKDPNPTESPA